MGAPPGARGSGGRLGRLVHGCPVSADLTFPAQIDDPQALEQIALAAVSHLIRDSGPVVGAILLHGDGSLRARPLWRGALDGLEDEARRLSARAVILMADAGEPAFDLVVTAVSSSAALAWTVSVAYDNRDWRLVDVLDVAAKPGDERLRELLTTIPG